MAEVEQPHRSGAFGQLVYSAVFLLLFGAIFILIGGDVRWVEGWIFAAAFTVFSVATVFRMYLKDPELLHERMGPPFQKGQSFWDKLMIVLIVVTYVAWYVILPLDAVRYNWSPAFPLWLKVLGFFICIFGFWMFYETFRENTFAAPVVKIQHDRKQHVISTGLYGIVRHPLYLGGITYVLGGTLLIGSLYGLVSTATFAVVLAIRTLIEESTLSRDLEGYKEYMEKVRWRLIPLIF
ncbi:MAG: isoprenylcysteine carboxylmethyltransferase family protein [Acidobacteriota bacterium]